MESPPSITALTREVFSPTKLSTMAASSTSSTDRTMKEKAHMISLTVEEYEKLKAAANKPTRSTVKESKLQAKYLTVADPSDSSREISVPIVQYDGEWMLRYGSRKMAYMAGIDRPARPKNVSPAYKWGDRTNKDLVKVEKKDAKGQTVTKYVVKRKPNEKGPSPAQIAQRKKFAEAAAKRRADLKSKGIVTKTAQRKVAIEALEKKLRAAGSNYDMLLKAFVDAGYTKRGAAGAITRYSKKHTDLKIVFPDGRVYITVAEKK